MSREDNEGPPVVPELSGAEEQLGLFEGAEVEPDWTAAWKGMPDYQHENMHAKQSVLVHFRSIADREDFSKVIGQRIGSSTKFLWYPKSEIGHAADKVWTGARANPRYPVYIISKGRWDTRLTSKAFEFAGVPYHIVVEPQEYDHYAAVIDPKKILTLPFSNLGLGGIPARNWVWEHSISTGAARHWIFDDNVSGFCRFHNNLKVEVDSGVLHKLIEDWCDRYENVQMAGFNYDYFAPRKQGARIKPITLNTRIYSGILLSNSISHRWRGRYNEDTDLSLRILKDGHCTALFNAFLMYKAPTLTMKGGNTDVLYAGAEAAADAWAAHAAACRTCGPCLDGYGGRTAGPCPAGRDILSKDGRWLMAESLREQHPDVTTVERKWRRWQHQVDYRMFGLPGRNTLVLRPDAVIPEGTDYEFTLAPMPPDEGQPAPAASAAQPVAKPAEVLQAQGQAPAAPSALDFASAPVASSLEQPVDAASPSEEGKALASESTPPQASQNQPTAEQAAAAQALKEALAAAGHRLLTLDGRLFVTNSSNVDAAMRAQMIALKGPLLLLAESPPMPEASTTQKALFQEPAALAAVDLRDVTRYVGDWRPDEFPDLTGIDTVVLNFATSGLEWARGDKPVGLTVSTLDGRLTRFLPFGFAHGGNHDENAVKRWATEQLRNKKIVNARTKFDIHHARVWGIDLEAQGCTFSDIQHTAALLDDHRKRFALDVLAAEYLPEVATVARVDESQHANYHASEVAERERFTAQLVGRLTMLLQPQIDAQGLREIHDLEDSVIPVVVEMEKNGAPLDVALLEQYAAECAAKHDELMWEIAREAGFAFEHAAAGWTRLLDKLGLPIPDSFDEATLGEIDHPLIRKGQLAAQYASLNSKTFKAYRDQVGPDGILRYEINQLRGDEGGTVSGRFSIGYVQQVPNHDNHFAVFGESLYPRRLFIAAPGSEYMAADAMQIEYRLFAHYANNPQVLAAYKADPTISFHRMTHERMKAYKPDMLYAHQKSFNFARQYGAKSVKLAVMMKFITAKIGEDIRRHKRWDDTRLALIREIEAAYQKMMPEGDMLLARAAHLAKPSCDEHCNQRDSFHRARLEHRGYVKTLRGRRSRFPNNYKTYIGLNRVLQGTAADLMKMKMVELHRERKHTGFLMRMTVHDELAGDKQQPETLARVMDILNGQSYPELRVPILWEGKTGETWADCK
jgi:DNA polymerase I-like protein with 3'-5' exonuclease and polymerase domains